MIICNIEGAVKNKNDQFCSQHHGCVMLSTFSLMCTFTFLTINHKKKKKKRGGGEKEFLDGPRNHITSVHQDKTRSTKQNILDTKQI